MHREIANVHKALATIQASISDPRTERSRETARKRDALSKLDSRIDVLEADQERQMAE